MKKLDQYGFPVPDDLVLLPDVRRLTANEIVKIMNANWYVTDAGTLLVGWVEAGCSFTGTEATDLDDELLYIVPSMLHRWSMADGFYSV